MAKKRTKKLLKQVRRTASPARVALLGALGGVAVAWVNRSRLQAGLEKLRAVRAEAAQPAE